MTTYLANNPVPMRTLPTTTGVEQTFLVTDTNAGDSTYAPDGLAAAPIFGLGGEPLQGNEMVAGGVAKLVSFVEPLLNSGNLCWVLLESTSGAQQVGTGTGSNQASTVGQVQTGSLITATASGTSNALAATIPSTLTALADGQPFTIIAAAANTGAATLALTLGGTALSTLPVVKGNGRALDSGDIPAAGYPILLNFSTEFSGFVMQNPVVGINRPIAVVGSQRNLKATLDTAGKSITYTADQVVLATAIDGVPFLIPNFNQTFDGTKIGLGGMDASPLPPSTFVAFYAALTAAGDQGIFGTVASGLVGEVYGGAHLPEDVIATALIGVWRVDSNGNLIVGKQRGRRVSFILSIVLSTAAVTGESAFLPFSVAPIIPPNAVSVGGTMEVLVIGANSTPALDLSSSGTLGGVDAQSLAGFNTSGEGTSCNFLLDFETPQTLFFSSTNLAGTPTYTVAASSYSF